MLNTKMAFSDHDAIYQELVTAHKDLTTEESAALNARLILVLANHIGDHNTLSQAIQLAKDSGSST